MNKIITNKQSTRGTPREFINSHRISRLAEILISRDATCAVLRLYRKIENKVNRIIKIKFTITIWQYIRCAHVHHSDSRFLQFCQQVLENWDTHETKESNDINVPIRQ